MKEVWKDIKGYPGYQVSNKGQVRSFRIPGSSKISVHSMQSHIVHPEVLPTKKGGHKRIRLYGQRKDETVFRRAYSVHRLVLNAFVGSCPNGKECCHWDGNPTNNNLKNLRWGTRKENAQDRIRHGHQIMGEKVPQHKLTKNQIKKIRHLHKNGMPYRKLAPKFHVSVMTIGQIVRYERWKHIS